MAIYRKRINGVEGLVGACPLTAASPGEGWRAVRDAKRGRQEDPPGAGRGSRQGLRLPGPGGRALHNAGFTAPIVMQLGGWRTEKMMRRYAAVTDTTLRAAPEAVRGAPRARRGVRRTARPHRRAGTCPASVP